MQNFEDNFSARPNGFKTVIYGGLLVGVLDGSAAIISAAISGVSAARVFQYIAAAVLGRAAYIYGLQSVLLGVLLHFAVAFSVAAVYYLAACKIPFLIRHPFIGGAVYGTLVYAAMNFVIVPLTLAPPLPFSFLGLLQSLAIHILFVGLPAALVVRRNLKYQINNQKKLL